MYPAMIIVKTDYSVINTKAANLIVTRDVEAAIFELLRLPPLAVLLPPFNDIVFAKNFFQLSKDKIALLYST